MPRVFISYKRADKEKVFPLKDKIEAAIGEPCWIDLEGIDCELKEWEDVVIKAINEASVFIFVYSKTLSEVVDFEDDRTFDEFAYAREKKKRIVFVNIDATPLTDRFAFRFGARQQVDGTSEGAINRLIKDIRKWLDCKETKIEEKKKDPFIATKPIPSGYVDLGLTSGTIWKKQSEYGLFTFKDSLARFGKRLPNLEQFRELISECDWTWEENGYNITGPSGNSIKLLANGYKTGDQLIDVNVCGHYWTNKLQTDTYAYALEFSPSDIHIKEHFISYMRSVHLIDA